MGGSSFKAAEEIVGGTPLKAPARPLVVVDAAHCSDATRTLLIKHTATGGDMTITATSSTAAGDLVCEILHHGSGCRVINGSSMSYSVRLPVPFAPSDVGIFKRLLKENVPVVVGEVRDRVSGQRFSIGYTGIWSYKHTAVIWLANENTPPAERVAIARVVPSHRTALRVNYLLEIAPGVDASVLMMVIAVLDVGATMP